MMWAYFNIWAYITNGAHMEMITLSTFSGIQVKWVKELFYYALDWTSKF